MTTLCGNTVAAIGENGYILHGTATYSISRDEGQTIYALITMHDGETFHFAIGKDHPLYEAYYAEAKDLPDARHGSLAFVRLIEDGDLMREVDRHFGNACEYYEDGAAYALIRQDEADNAERFDDLLLTDDAFFDTLHAYTETRANFIAERREKAAFVWAFEQTAELQRRVGYALA